MQIHSSGKSGNLYLVAIPIGNYDDITFRALNILKSVDVFVCEEEREGNRFLHRFKLQPPIFELLNEHNERENAPEIIRYLVEGKNVALISDCGTPVFSDPGKELVKQAIEYNINIIPIPGASSIVPALVLAGFRMDAFHFVGFLSPKKEERFSELLQYRSEDRTIILMDAPYRLLQLLQDIVKVFGKERRVAVAWNLTMNDEQIYRGKAQELYEHFEQNKAKGEFVVVVEGYSRKREVNSGKDEVE